MQTRHLFNTLSFLIIGLITLGSTSCISSKDESARSSTTKTGVTSGYVNLLSKELYPQWIQIGGKAKYELKDGVLTGMSVPNTQNSFLCPPKRYANFELQFEVKCEPRLNSGVQIRSSNDLKGMNDKMADSSKERIVNILGKEDRMFGPQVEIAANGNAGGIWFEVGRGWLEKPDAEHGKTIYKNDDWNQYRVIANGPRIQVFINGEQITDLVDEKTFMKEGYLGFQVHSVGFADPSYVMWRNITIKELP